MQKYVDFDAFMREREGAKITVKIFGRECKVPAELPLGFMIKMLRANEGDSPVQLTDNIKLLAEMFSAEDFDCISEHPSFTASMVPMIIANIWLNEDEKSDEPVDVTEDDLAIEASGGNKRKKA